MRLVWNGTQRDEDEVVVFADKYRRDLTFGRASVIKHSWKVYGFLKADSFAGLKSKMEEVDDMFSVQRGDLSYVDNNGTAMPGFVLESDNMVNGVRLVRKRWVPMDPTGKGVWGAGADLVRFKGYELEFQAEQIDEESSEVVQYSERYSARGLGIDKTFLVESLTGIPQPQTTIADTITVVIQQGHSIGLTNYLDDAIPLYSSNELTHLRVMEREREQYGFNTRTMFPKRWTFVFQFPGTVDQVPFPDPEF